jgi:hypothetical protein
MEFTGIESACNMVYSTGHYLLPISPCTIEAIEKLHTPQKTEYKPPQSNHTIPGYLIFGLSNTSRDTLNAIFVAIPTVSRSYTIMRKTIHHHHNTTLTYNMLNSIHPHSSSFKGCLSATMNVLYPGCSVISGASCLSGCGSSGAAVEAVSPNYA